MNLYSQIYIQMKKILILGAGKSSSYLIKSLVEKAANWNFSLQIIDINTSLIPQEFRNLPHVTIYELPSGDISQYESFIQGSFITISMLPASLHLSIAKLCLSCNSHLITPSYISDEMWAMNEEVKQKNLIFLNEMGFDPGIDHMTTMEIYQKIQVQGGRLHTYKSYAGGLVAKKNDDNPWHYKFSWNPRNVILAGQGGDIKYFEKKEEVTISYAQLFHKAEKLILSNGSKFDAYANRDSAKYLSLYQWKDMDTILRGTLRYDGFCEAWSVLVNIGLTDDKMKLDNQIGLSYADFYAQFTHKNHTDFLSNLKNEIKEKLIYIGLNDTTSTITQNGSPAEILQSILEKKWKLTPTDTDWIVMVHIFEYELNGKNYRLESFLSVEGQDNLYTAMAQTVGMPIVYAVDAILHGQWNSVGVHLPIDSALYLPILQKLEAIGIQFKENVIEI